MIAKTAWGNVLVPTWFFFSAFFFFLCALLVELLSGMFFFYQALTKMPGFENGISAPKCVGGGRVGGARIKP